MILLLTNTVYRLFIVCERRILDTGFFAAKMIFYGSNPPVINAAGDALGIDGAARNIGYKEVDTGQYDAEREVFGACAGAALYRREIFDEIGLFDEDFYIILEDVDLDFRDNWQVIGVYMCRRQ